MKKFIGIILVASLMFIFTACAGTETPPAAAPTPPAPPAPVTAAPEPAPAPVVEDEGPQYVTVTYFDAAGDAHEVVVRQNPTSVAVFDWSILDMLYTIGWENTGIETLVIPATATLPAEIAWFADQDFVIRGGTLHYVNWDVLDLVEPELVILGMRSFAHNAAGETTTPEARAELRAEAEAKYPDTAFIRLTQSSTRSNLLNDTAHNAAILAQIFPNIADDIEAYMAETRAAINEIQTKVQESESTALFVMVWADRMSIFLYGSRFHMIYDEFGFTPAAESLPQWTDQHGLDARAEFILSSDPDVILLLDRTDMASPTGGVGVQNFMADSIIANTTAAQNGNIFVLEGNAWYTVTGGFSATQTKIANIMEFVNTLE